MNKIEINGKELLNIDEVNTAIRDTNENTVSLRTKVSSDEVTKIKIVNEYPQEEETGVLYIKLENSNS